MATDLPTHTPDELARELRRRSPVELSDAVVAALDALYRELARWVPRLALIGPGTTDEVLDRHFGESLTALSLLPPRGRAGRTFLDLGSGAGFPGLVLAAARPDLTVILTEPRERKWAFLKTAARKAALPCRCLNARVDFPLPSELPTALDGVTVRALQVPPEVLEALAERLAPDGRFLLWVGDEEPQPPPGWATRRTVSLPGSERRRIVEWRREESPPEGGGNASEPDTEDR